MKQDIVVVIGKKNTYLNAVRNLALEVYDHKDVSQLSKYHELYKKCPEGFIFAFEKATHRLVGYIIALPLKEDYFHKSCLPDFKEQGLDQSVVIPYQNGNNYINFFSIVVKQDHEQRLTILSSLSKAFAQQCRNNAKQGRYVIEASALALTKAGHSICQALKMEHVGTNDKGCVYVNKDFDKLYINEETKDSILRTFVKYKQMRKNGPK